MNKDITNADNLMAERIAYHGGLVASVKRTAFHTTMTSTDTTAVRLTEISPVLLDGLARIAGCSVFLEMTNAGITLATRRVTECA